MKKTFIVIFSYYQNICENLLHCVSQRITKLLDQSNLFNMVATYETLVPGPSLLEVVAGCSGCYCSYQLFSTQAPLQLIGMDLITFTYFKNINKIKSTFTHQGQNLDDSLPEVTIQQGTLKGFRLTSRKGREFFAFQRIPYAKSPVGDLRFRSPQPLEKWEGVLDATEDVPKCTQKDTFRGQNTASGQEDCLFINVYTPRIDGQDLLDVMVYIHGGGFFAGWGSKHGPAYLMDQNVVYVNFNYRLGALGRSPQLPEPWNGILDATQTPPPCIQRNIFTFDENVTGSEDCLYLDVYTPKKDGNFNVMVYFHGGGWLAGTSSYIGPKFLLDRDLVLVTVNYRLGPLGFLSTGDSICPGNNGLKDQVVALRWVRDNIAAFGGNPGSVTIFGESAGGATTHYLMLSPASQGLFHRVISESGTALGLWAIAPNGSSVHQAKKVASLLNCPTHPSKALVNCLRRREAADIIKTDTAFMQWSIDPALTFKPVLERDVPKDDEIFLPAHPLKLIANASAVPWMTGITSSDGAFVASRIFGKNLIDDMDKKFNFVGPLIMHYSEIPKSDQDLITKKLRDFYFKGGSMNRGTVHQIVNMFTDSWFLSGADEAVKLHVDTDAAPVFYYYFDYRGTDSYSTLYGDPTTDYGVSHSDELLYILYDDVTFPNRTLSEDDEKMVDIMTSIWANFASTGNPTPDSNEFGAWPAVMSLDVPEYGHITLEGVQIKRGLLKDRTSFWSTLPRLRFAAALTIVASAVIAEDIVRIKQGLLRGHSLVSRRGREIFAFQGIPYAKPPVGELRFQPPQPPEKWDDVRDAIQDGPECFQKPLFVSGTVKGQEDCLYLNVYTPKLPDNNANSDSDLLDVMFWIHGGGWVSGSGGSDLYGPQYLLDKNVILVTINYRLGPFGFLSTGDSVCPGNNGLKDQVAALRWVQDNIAAFGGNPSSVTIFGESAGGSSVHFLMLSALGQATCPWAVPSQSTKTETKHLAMKLGCPTTTSNELVSCLRNREAIEIIETLKTFEKGKTDYDIAYRPTIEAVIEGEEAVITMDPFETLHSIDNLQLVPWMVGLLSGEGAIAISAQFSEEAGVEELDLRFEDIIASTLGLHFHHNMDKSDLRNIVKRIRNYYFGDQPINSNMTTAAVDMYTDAFVLFGTDVAVKLHTQRSAPVYYYFFDYRGTNSYSSYFGKNPTQPGSTANFWHPVSSLDNLEYVHIDSHGLRMSKGLLKERVDFWSTILNELQESAKKRDEL
ncbi:hypothetical protein C0J52_03842 [Blattella germanica]|nr:hypothetical protein C0J52_03842 [Blattella germanica]